VKSYAYCEVKSLDDDGDPFGSFEAILSAPTLDRDGEVIDAKAFEPLPDHIAIDVDHGMTVATTVASGAPFYDGDVLKIKGTYSSIPRAQELRTLVREGHIRKMSVTFMGAQRDEQDGVPHITKAELLNAAFVPIPSNREAAVLVAKAFAPTEGEKASEDELVALIDSRIAKALGAVADAVVYAPQSPEPAAASAETDPETAAPAVKSPVTGSAHLAAARAQAEAASVL
jgi:HK97 family phage prohead protease